jgi:DNA-directed RNA polymerase specialized sigma24 family protein
MNQNAPMTTENQLRDNLEDALLDAGTAPTTQLLDRLETAAEQRAFELAGQQIGTLIAQLDIRQRVVWQRLMGVGPTLDECAAKLGVSKPAIHQAEKRLRRRLEKNRLPGAHK